MTAVNADIWILAEQSQGIIQRVTFELITRGLKLSAKRNCKLCVMLFGHGISDQDLQDLIDRGANKIVYLEHTDLKDFLIEPFSDAMCGIISQYNPEVILAGATTTGRTLMPYVAIKVNTGLTADCTSLDIEPETGNLIQTRPAIGGNIMASILTPEHRPQMATVRPRSTSSAENNGPRIGEIIKTSPEKLTSSRLTLVKFSPFEDKINISDADIVVTVGRGIKKKENLSIIYDLAETLNAAIGATREVVDRDWLSYSHQVGLSGHTISPKLYIGIGLSGSIQHIAGMQTSEKIIAINNDPDAQIFKLADYGIVGDLFEIVPLLTQKLRDGAKL